MQEMTLALIRSRLQSRDVEMKYLLRDVCSGLISQPSAVQQKLSVKQSAIAKTCVAHNIDENLPVTQHHPFT